MRYTNFAAGCVGKVFTSILCIVLGIVITLGGIVGGGFYFAKKQGTMGKIEDLASKNNIKIDWEDDISNLSVYDWVDKKLIPIFAEFSTTKIGEIEKAIGMDLISKNVNDLTGLSIDTIKESTLKDFGKTFSENMTVANASDKFGIEFPDLPAFKEEQFLNSPLSTAFAQIEDFEIQDFIEVTDQSSPILLNLADLKIGELSDEENGIDARVNALELQQVITIVEEGENKSNAVLIKLKSTKVGELGSPSTNETIMQMELQEIIDITKGQSTHVLWELRSTPLGELGDPITDDKIKNMKIKDLITIDENSTSIMQYFAANDTTLAGEDEFGNPNGVNQAIKVMTLKDMMTLTDPSEPDSTTTKFMWALRDCPMETIPEEGENPEVLGIEDTLKITPFSQLLETSDSHIWQYLGTSTIETIGGDVDGMAVADAIEITEESPAILRKMRVAKEGEDSELFGIEDVKLNELNTKLEPLILDLELGEILTITFDPENPDAVTNSEPILVALKNVKISAMNEAIKNLSVNQVFRPSIYNNGVMALIDPNTQITDISTVMAVAVTNARLQMLINLGIMAPPTVNDVEIQSTLRNNDVNGIMSDYSAIINAIYSQTPTSINHLIPERHFLSLTIPAGEDYAILDQEYLNNLVDFDEGETLILNCDTKISGNFHNIFNIMLNGKTLIFEDAVIRSSDYDPNNDIYSNDKGGFIFISNDEDTSLGVSGGGSMIGSFAHPLTVNLINPEDPNLIKEHYKITIDIIDPNS